MYIDLDTVITGPLDDALAGYCGTFSTLATDGMLNERRTGGYNSSVMMWDADDGSCASIYDTLAAHYDTVHRFLYKFDHWLELMVPTESCDILQRLFPGHFVEFKQYERDRDHQEQARLVTFPLHPKPHDCVAAWVKEKWV